MAGNGTGGLQRGAMNAQAILCSGSEMFAASRRLVRLLPSAPLLRAFKGGPRACAERAGMALGFAVVSSPQRVIASRRRRRSNPLADVPGCAVTAPPAQPVEALCHCETGAAGRSHPLTAPPAQPVEALCHCETGAAGRSHPASPAGVRGHYKTAAGGEAIPSLRHRRSRSKHAVIASRRRRRSNPLADVPGCAVTAPPAQPVEALCHCETGAAGRSHPLTAPPAQPVEALCHCETGAAGRSHPLTAPPAQPVEALCHCETGAAGRSHPLTAPPPQPVEAIPSQTCRGALSLRAAAGGEAIPSQTCRGALSLRAAAGGEAIPSQTCRGALSLRAAAGGEAIPSQTCRGARSRRHRRSRSKHSVIARPAQPVEAIPSRRHRRSRSKHAVIARPAQPVEAIPSRRHRRSRSKHAVIARPAQPVEAIPPPLRVFAGITRPPQEAKPSPHPLPLSRARERGDRRRARDRPTVSVPMFARGFGPPLKRR
ncbi:MAG: hypothetical protein KatS3mg058_1787 [Roseiflexus sp.]|nr:MAG: hypothetical protein KatS3mg058_1787 [Roseiflexus sp.]